MTVLWRDTNTNVAKTVTVTCSCLLDTDAAKVYDRIIRTLTSEMWKLQIALIIPL